MAVIRATRFPKDIVTSLLFSRAAYCATRQGENSGHVLSVSLAHWTALSVWQVLQELGTFIVSVASGGMNLNVWLRTLMSAMVCSILGIWQPIHALPADPR